MSSPEEFIRGWIGTPHVYNGRDKKGVDCYGLVWLYYRDVLGTILPDWSCIDMSRLWVSHFMNKQVKDRLEVIDAPEDHCIAVLRRDKVANHVGIVYRDNFFHCAEGQSTVYQPLHIVYSMYGTLIYGHPRIEALQ
jgi:cell wall-associated NlpC family hydrolase